jgi:hypothetical protein
MAFFLAVGPVLILFHLGDWLELATELWGYYHNVPYHRLVWFFNQNKYGHEAGRARRFGLATLVNSRWLAYIACAALYAFIFDFVPRFILKQQVALMAVNTRNQVIFSFFAAPGLLHYWLDGHIWKVRSDPDLRTYLRL